MTDNVGREFHIPTYLSLGIQAPAGTSLDAPVHYLCGNSLGCMPEGMRAAIGAELDAWGARAVEAHFNHPGGTVATPWIDIDLPVAPLLAPMVGAKTEEVAVMGSLTANLNALMVAFYRPVGKRVKILFEKRAFPSDFHAFWNQARLHGLDPSEVLEQIGPRSGEFEIRTEDILAKIDELQDTLALVCLPGVQYYTGQFFDMAAITAHARKIPGVVVGWDLAHAVGNVPLELHEWGVDFAAWCSYKYMNAGPGAIAGIFVHERHGSSGMARLSGWWGCNAATRFDMKEEYTPLEGALGFRQSNPSVLDVVALHTALKSFEAYGGMRYIRARSLELTGRLYELLQMSKHYTAVPLENAVRPWFTIITPADASKRGAQLSLLFGPHHENGMENTMNRVFEYMRSHGVIGDERKPDVIRLAPVPLYNSMEDVEVAARVVNEALESLL